MNVKELEHHLHTLASQSILPCYELDGIIDAIIDIWFAFSNFTDENAVKTMEHFLQTRILNFSLYKNQ